MVIDLGWRDGSVPTYFLLHTSTAATADRAGVVFTLPGHFADKPTRRLVNSQTSQLADSDLFLITERLHFVTLNLKAYRTTRRQTNLRSVKSRTG